MCLFVCVLCVCTAPNDGRNISGVNAAADIAFVLWLLLCVLLWMLLYILLCIFTNPSDVWRPLRGSPMVGLLRVIAGGDAVCFCVGASDGGGDEEEDDDDDDVVVVVVVVVEYEKEVNIGEEEEEDEEEEEEEYDDDDDGNAYARASSITCAYSPVRVFSLNTLERGMLPVYADGGCSIICDASFRIFVCALFVALLVLLFPLLELPLLLF